MCQLRKAHPKLKLLPIAEAYKCDYIKLIEAAGFSDDPSYNPTLK